MCSYEVLKNFEQKLEHCSFRNDFIKDILTSELEEERIYVYFAKPHEFCARIHDPRIYYLI